MNHGVIGGIFTLLPAITLMTFLLIAHMLIDHMARSLKYKTGGGILEEKVL